MKQKIIFLDFDGVVSSQVETPGSYITHESNEYGASPSCLKHLKQLCDDCDAKIVISSNWRKFEDDSPCSFWIYDKVPRIVFNPLPNFKKQMEGYVIDSLPKAHHMTKAQALILWFKQKGLSEDSIDYVILDDDLDEGFSSTAEYCIKDHFIQTSSITGLAELDVIKAKSILKCTTAKELNHFSSMPCIFICSPYSGNVNENIANAKRYARYAALKGNAVFVPHLLYPQFLYDSIDYERNIGIQSGIEFLWFCDEMWVFAKNEDSCSNGMKIEIDEARKIPNLKIRFIDPNMIVC